MFVLQYLRQTTSKDLLYSTGNSAQCREAAQMGEEFGRMDTCVCMAESLHCSPETITALLTGYNSQYEIKSFEKTITILLVGYIPIQNKV